MPVPALFRFLPAAGVLALTALLAAPVHSQGAPEGDTPPASEIERFCSNVTDAARELRFQFQVRELDLLQREVDERIEALEEKRREYEQWLERRNRFAEMAEQAVVEIYGRMRPDAAAERMAELQVELAAAILLKLDSRRAGVILNEMEAKSAARLTGIMASAARKADPS